MINTVPIVFHSGCYGTYLEWVLYTLTTDIPIVAPFTVNGSSHQYTGWHLSNIKGWRKYLDINFPAQFVRFHPKILEDESISENLNEIMESVNHMIYIHPDLETRLLTINNEFTKVRPPWAYIDLDQVYNNWPVSRDIPIDKVPAWIQREFLSFYLMPRWEAQVEWNHLENWSHPNSLPVLVKDLLYNFESTMHTIKEFCGLAFVKSITDLLPIHDRMLELQIYQNQDQLANSIVESTVNTALLDWSTTPTTLATESWIQWQLRNLGFEIRCDGLNVFPNNSTDLQRLLYKG